VIDQNGSFLGVWRGWEMAPCTQVCGWISLV